MLKYFSYLNGNVVMYNSYLLVVFILYSLVLLFARGL